MSLCIGNLRSRVSFRACSLALSVICEFGVEVLLVDVVVVGVLEYEVYVKHVASVSVNVLVDCVAIVFTFFCVRFFGVR